MNGKCKACEVRGKTWKGDDPKCSFPEGVFDPAGWACALALKIRLLAEREDDPRIHHYCPENQHYATIDTMGLDVLPYEDGEGRLNAQPVCLFVGWYKSRGRTEAMWLMFENDPPRKPTEEECLTILNHYGESQVDLDKIKGSLLPRDFSPVGDLAGNDIPLQNPYQSRYKTVSEDTALQIARVILKTSDDVSQVWDAAVSIGIVIPVGEVTQEIKERFYDSITIIRDIL